MSNNYSIIKKEISFLFFFSAPSAPPPYIGICNVTSSSIIVQWEQVDFKDRNGNITGYSVQYGVQGSEHSNTLNVSGGETTEVIISDLDSATNYSIEVAAVNSAGIGVYSIAMYALTIGKILHQHFTLLMFLCNIPKCEII